MTTQFLFANFFSTELLLSITEATTELSISSDAIAKMPQIPVNKEMRLTLWDGQSDPEIVGCTANNAGYLVVNRAQEGTTARAWSAGTQVRSAMTADIINQALTAYYSLQEVLSNSYLALSGGTLTGNLILANNPTDPLGATPKQYVDAIQGNKLPLTGGTMQGAINMNSNRILSLPVPTSGGEPARKTELDADYTALSAIFADRSGLLLTAGTSSAFTVATNQGFTSLVDGTLLKIRFHTTNARNAQITVDTAPAAPIQLDPTVAIPAGALYTTVPVDIMYSAAFSAWLVCGSRKSTSTGDVKFSIKTVADPGWLVMNDQTIGRTGSTAGFADDSAQDLYYLLYNNVTDTYAPVTGGRGANAAADWTAGKPIQLLRALGRALARSGTGLNLPSTRLLGQTIGVESVALIRDNLPSVNITGTGTPTLAGGQAATGVVPGTGGQSIQGGASFVGYSTTAFQAFDVMTVTSNLNPNAQVLTSLYQPTLFLTVMIAL